MRPPLNSLFLAVSAGVLLVGAGCASRPAPDNKTAEAAEVRGCENEADANPLHLTSSADAASSEATRVDPEIQAILMQQPADRWLAQLNRSMYWSLRTLDAELRREQRVAACEHPEIMAGGGAAAQGVAAAAPAPAAGGGSAGAAAPAAVLSAPEAAPAPVTPAVLTPAPAAVSATVQPAAMASSSSAAVSRTATLRKTSLSTNAASGGNGLTARKAVPGSDNEIVARRLRKAAEQETNPTLRAKLWKEYTDYEHGASPK